jgi:hypothetical protein
MDPRREQWVATAQNTWIVDPFRRRFRRVPRGSDPADPTVPIHWLPFHRVWRDPRTGALTLALDRTGTRLLRVGP